MRNSYRLLRNIAIPVIASIALYTIPVQAADEHGMYQTLHLITCESYVKDRKEPVDTGMNAVDTIYVAGWLSGYNYLTPNTYQIIPNNNLGAVMTWLDEFCKVNPTSNIEVALLKLTDDLYPKRIQSLPKPATVTPAAPAKADPKAASPEKKK